MAAPSIKTVKRLFAVSGNRCAFPGCQNPIVEESGTITGQIAHICAASENGPRYDSHQSDDERHGFGNLLLLCGRHHTIIDSEVSRHSIAFLQEIKQSRKLSGPVEITPACGTAAQGLIASYEKIIIMNTTGNVAVNSPGAIQAGTVNINSMKKEVRFNPPTDSIGSSANPASYVEYLIGKFQDYQKQDTEKQGRGKYTIIYRAIKNEFGSKWQTFPLSKFDSLCSLLKRRIDNSMIGRIRKANGQKRYHSYDEHIGDADT